MTWIEWYGSLVKPSWTPAPSTISLIWMLLYPVILVIFGFVFVKAFQRRLPRLVALPFAVNLVANVLFMPIFAGLRNVPLAAADIVVVWATILSWSLSGRITAGSPLPRCRTSCGCRSPQRSSCRSRR